MQRFSRRGCCLGLILALTVPLYAQEPKPTKTTLDGWNQYITLTERRIQSELNNPGAFVRTDFTLLKRGGVYLQKLSTKDEKGKEIEIKGGDIHHWLGAVYIPGKDLESLLKWVQDYDRHQDYFKEVEQSSVKDRSGDRYEIFLRLVRSKMGVTARFNTEHRITYSRHGSGRASSKSEGTKIAQLDSSGKEYAPGRDSGYLWKLNSYWRFSERDGGVIVECESVGLSRELGSWVGILDFLAFGRIRKIAESVASEALNDTLVALRDGAKGGPKKRQAN